MNFVSVAILNGPSLTHQQRPFLFAVCEDLQNSMKTLCKQQSEDLLLTVAESTTENLNQPESSNVWQLDINK